MICRSCSSVEFTSFADLGFAPPSNSYLTSETKNTMEQHFPLRIFVCNSCYLAQTQDFADRNLFFNENYAYFSSYSQSWLLHCKKYVDQVIPKANLNRESFVVEVASNDGYLLDFFKSGDIPVLGIEPSESTAKVSQVKNIDTVVDFFSAELASDLVQSHGFADLMIANNVLAHVPDINDFIKGFSILLKDEGFATFEFPHLLNLIKYSQFDTFYHEHYSYLSLIALTPIFERHSLKLFDLEILNTHGGSLRIYVAKSNSSFHITENVRDALEAEQKFGLKSLSTYLDFQKRYQEIKNEFLDFLITSKKAGKKIVAYGAAAKGNTLLNYCGIRSDVIEFVADVNIHKQGMYLPGSCIPIVSIVELTESEPDIVIILPWNLSEEIVELLSSKLSERTEFYVAIPKLLKVR